MAKQEFIGVIEVAQRLGVSERQARTLVQRHGGQMVGGSWIIAVAALAKIPRDRKAGRPRKSQS